MVCDNITGDPVDMLLGHAASELTLGIVAVNAETSSMLHSYVARPQRGETYQLYTEGCPYNVDQFTSQVRTRHPGDCPPCDSPPHRRLVGWVKSSRAVGRCWCGVSAS